MEIDKRRAVLATLGTGEGSETPVVKTVKEIRPDILVMFATHDSVDKEMDKKASEGMPEKCRAKNVTVVNCNTPDEIYKKALKEMRSLLADGIDASEIHINYTPGTKAMSVGLVLAGVAAGCVNFHYTGGSARDAKSGRVKKGFEEKSISELSFVKLDYRIRQAKSFFNAGEFIAAKKALEEAEERFGALSQGTGPAVYLNSAIDAYHAWQTGDYDAAREQLKKLSLTDEAEEFFGKKAQKQISENKEVLFLMDRKPQLKVFDRAAGALAACGKGFYSLGAEDIYSSLEFMAAFLMQKNNIDKSAVDPVKLGERGIDVSGFITEKKGIGLFDSFKVLAALKEPMALKFIEDKEIFNALKTRNEHIHKGVHVKKKDAMNFYEKTLPYYAMFLAGHGDIKERNAEKLIEKFRFPQL